MRDARSLAVAAASEDPAEGLRAIVALRVVLDELERRHVRDARSRGWTWREVADELGVSMQAAHQKFVGRQGMP